MYVYVYIYIYIYSNERHAGLPHGLLPGRQNPPGHRGELGEHKPGRIKPGRIKRAALSLQNQNYYMLFFDTTPFICL